MLPEAAPRRRSVHYGVFTLGAVHPAGHLRATLGAGGFRRLLRVRLASQLADGVFQASLAGSVFFNPDRQADPLAVAIGFAALVLPYSVVGPFAGVVLDRVRRRDVLLGANLLRAAAVPLVAVPVWHGEQGWPLVLGALAVIGVNRFFLAGLSASLPHVVPPDRLVTANSVSTTAGTVAFVAGGALAVALLPLAGAGDRGYALVAALSALGYLASAVAARGFPATRLGPDRTVTGATAAEVARGLVEGVRHLAERRTAGYALLALSGHRVLFGVTTVAMLLLYRNHFGTGLAGLGRAVVAGALGALVAAAVTPWVVRRLAPRYWVAGLLAAAGVAQGVLGAPYLPGPLVAAAFVVGLAGQGVKIVTDTAVQTACDDDFRGRVFSVYDTLFNAAMVAGLFAGALTLPPDGRSHVVLAAVATAYVALGVGYATAATRVDHRRYRRAHLNDS
jgi:MFS family permease